MTTNGKRRFNQLIGLIVALVGLTAVLVVQHIPNRHRMEADLTHRSEQALRSAGLPQVQVTFTGRDGQLRAGSPTDADRALGVVRGLEGVRVVEAKVPPTSKTAAVRVPPNVIFTLSDGKVSVAGRVPTEAARSVLVQAAAESRGGVVVDNRLAVDDVVTDAYLSGLPEVFRAFGRNVEKATMELSGDKLVLTGTVSSEVKKIAVLSAAGGVGAAVVDRIRVADVQQQLTRLPPLTFGFGGVSLTSATRASLVAASRILKDNPSVRISIDGHTDSRGSAESNLSFSRARARMVRDFLVAQGVSADRLSPNGYGEARPKVPNTSAANRAVNRRAELVVRNDLPQGIRGNNGT